jgi:hypothetical protein
MLPLNFSRYQMEVGQRDTEAANVRRRLRLASGLCLDHSAVEEVDNAGVEELWQSLTTEQRRILTEQLRVSRRRVAIERNVPVGLELGSTRIGESVAGDGIARSRCREFLSFAIGKASEPTK